MITKTINLDNKYQSLYDEIREKSNGAIDINNIEQFFGNIIEIAQLDKKFLRLPLDEPIFEIDANTRVISVPSEFRSNGLSVQGDHLAETVFFSIDRYFDRMDLSVTDITINWKMGTTSGKTKNFIMSKDIIPGKVVFGWPINNIITQKSGSLTFAIEFSLKNEGEILYDFNTLSASINIKDGLVIGSDIEAVSLDDEVLGILTNSVFGEGDAAVGPIEWISGNGQGLVCGVNVDNAINLLDYQNPLMLDTVIDSNGIPSSVIANLYGQAYVDEGTKVVYTDASNNPLELVMVNIPKVLEEINDRTNLDENKKYYGSNPELGEITEIDFEDITEAYPEKLFAVKDLPDNIPLYVQIEDSEPIAYRKVTDTDKSDWYNYENIKNIYTGMAKIVVETDGTYIMKAQGIKQDTDGRKIGNGEISSCAPIIVPRVETPSGINIVKSEIDVTNNEYTFDADASANVVFLEEGEASLTANALVDNYGALQFIWQKKNGANWEDVDEIAPAYKVDGEFTANQDTLMIDAAGEYRVKVKNFQNGKFSNEVISDTYSASELADKIETAVCKANGSIIINNTAEFDSNASSMANRNVVLSIAAEAPSRGVLAYEWRKNDQVIGSTNNYQVTTEGYYTPVIKNIYNGSIYTKVLDTIFVNDRANDG